jgi:hypothetical protein
MHNCGTPELQGEDRHVTAAEMTSARPAVATGRELGASLADVSRILAALETPRIPPRLVARLDQALAAEAARSRGPGDSWSDGDGGSGNAREDTQSA